MVDTAIGTKSAPGFLKKALLSWYALMFMAVAAVAAGGTLFWYREQIADRYYEAKYNALSALGLGVVPVALWLAAFWFAMFKKPLWFLKWNLWAASVLLVAFALAAMAFRQPFEGSLAFFTMDGAVSLGGNLGATLIGEAAPWDAVRAGALLVAAFVVAAPAFALMLTVLAGRGVRFTYFYAMMALRGVFSALRWAFHMLAKVRLRKKRAVPADVELMDAAADDAPGVPGEAQAAALPTRPAHIDAYSIIANPAKYLDGVEDEGEAPEDAEELPVRRGVAPIITRPQPQMEDALAERPVRSGPAVDGAPAFLSSPAPAQQAQPAPSAYPKKVVPEIIRPAPAVAESAPSARPQPAPARPVTSQPSPVVASSQQAAPSRHAAATAAPAPARPAAAAPAPAPAASAIAADPHDASHWIAVEADEHAPKHAPMGTHKPAAPVPTSGLPTLGSGHNSGVAKMHTPVTPNVASTKGTSALPDIKGVTASSAPDAPPVVAQNVVATPRPTSVLPDIKGVTTPVNPSRPAVAAASSGAAQAAAASATSGGMTSVVAASLAAPVAPPRPQAPVTPPAAKSPAPAPKKDQEPEEDAEESMPAILRGQELGNAKFNRFWSPGEDIAAAKDVAPKVALEVLQEDIESDGGDVALIVNEAVAEKPAPKVAAPEPPPVLQSQWDLPPIDIMVRSQQGGISDQEMYHTADNIKRALADYGVDVEVGEIRPGPTVTMYGLIPGWIRKTKQVRVTDQDGNLQLNESGKSVVQKVETKMRVKVDAITAREKDLALALKTPSLRIETPVMGKSLIGIEVPNPKATLVSLRTLMETEQFQKLREKAKLPVAIGKGSGGETVVIDLARMPHLLVAGATGSGKSVFINTIISCLLMEKSPAELRLLLIDPKRVELTPYNGIPHLLTPVVVETDQVVGFLKGMIREMFDRYRRFEEAGAKNIDTYNTKMPLDKLPYLVVAVDELADLMMTASMEVEQAICRLAQLGRATGIHMVVATQRPSVDVVTGLIKANFPSRVSFAVTSQIDSRTILDMAGAEKMLGKGDMLYQAIDAPRPERVQGVYISDKEVEDLVHFWQTTPRAPMPEVYLHSVGDPAASDEDEDGDEVGIDESKDALLDKAIEIARHHKKLSTSLLQRRMRIGYPRAARLMDQLEDAGIVGPSDGSKSRDVIINAS